MQRKPLRVLVSSINLLDGVLPYQWALLKTYADEDPWLAKKVSWQKPFFADLGTARRELEDAEKLAIKWKLGRIDVLGLSCYVWNLKEQLRIAEIAKRVNKNCLVVAGGPELRYDDPDFFRKHPQIDIVVKKDGEIAFRKILSEKLKKGDFAKISGLVVRQEDQAMDTGEPESLTRFTRSPWLHNRKLIGEWIRKHNASGKPVVVFLETNRGCPYSCTFCNWGSATMSKLRLFEMSNISEEIEWFARKKIAALTLIDANFGILPRDLEICDRLCTFSKARSKPRISFYAAKNNVERSVEVALKLHRAGLLLVFLVGVQSTSQKTLNAIGRSNISYEKQVRITEILKKHEVPFELSLIIGCPGDSVATWRQSITDVLEMGVPDLVASPFHVLANSPADDPAYRKKWRIETIFRTCPDDLPAPGYFRELICASSSFSRDDYIEMTLYYLLAKNVMRFEPAARLLARLRSSHPDVSFREIFDALYDELFGNPEHARFHVEFERMKAYLHAFVYARDEAGFRPGVFVKKNSIENFYYPLTFFSERFAEDADAFCRKFEEFLAGRFGRRERNLA